MVDMLDGQQLEGELDVHLCQSCHMHMRHKSCTKWFFFSQTQSPYVPDGIDPTDSWLGHSVRSSLVLGMHFIAY